jgi:biopolymer transport protein TolR
MSEINVTPFVDVMLVLLIIFMVAAPLLTVGVEIDLPDADAPAIADQEEPLTISVTADAVLFLNDQEIAAANLVPRLRAITAENPDIPIFVRGDENTSYGAVMETWGMIKSAGFDEVALIVETPTVGQ